MGDSTQTCYCGRAKIFNDCCGAILSGRHRAVTAEDLMRARYCAYVIGDMDFLYRSLHPEQRPFYDLEATEQFAGQSQWLSLQVVGTERGGDKDARGSVGFIAEYRHLGQRRQHREHSLFKRYKGDWYFYRGEALASIKTGRNAPCVCGSGKKFKQCCGA